jgi:hypothetical protein
VGVDDAALHSRQAALQAEATQVLAVMGEIRELRRIGPLLPMGSYVSALMCWRDLDVGVCFGSEFTPPEVLELVRAMLAVVEVPSFAYRDERGDRSPTGERRDERYYLPLQIVCDSSDWRFDLSLWLYDDHAHVADWHRELRDRLTPAQRAAGLRIKDVWCRRTHYPDRISSFDIYSAVLPNRVATPREFGALATRPPVIRVRPRSCRSAGRRAAASGSRRRCSSIRCSSRSTWETAHTTSTSEMTSTS